MDPIQPEDNTEIETPGGGNENGGNEEGGNEEGGEQEDPEDLTAEFKLVSDKTRIFSDGEDYATLTVTLGGKEVTEGLTFYNGDKEIEIPEGKFSATDFGSYNLWVAYKTINTYKEILTIDAVPALPEDPQPESTSFKHKVLITQFTGTGCGYCPPVKTALHEYFTHETFAASAANAILASAHGFNSDDPAYIPGCGNLVSGFPTVMFDLRPDVTVGNPTTPAAIKRIVDELHSYWDAKAGISATFAYKDGKAMVNVAIKAAETGEFRVGAWLLEDAIEARQSNGTKDYHHIHDDCVRIVDSKTSSADWTGHNLGEIKEGETAEYIFQFDFKNNWVPENCHVAIFISFKDGKKYYVNNVVDCPINGQVQFDYLD